MSEHLNADPAELAKFSELAHRWWDAESEFKLVSKGIEKNRVYTEGKGEKQPIASNKTKEGRAKNRRVEIEVVGTRAAAK